MTSRSPLDARATELTRKARPASEWAAERMFRPLAQRLLGPVARTRVRPTTVVLGHTLLGVIAARLIARGGTWTPALLLQIKTVLDNLDGQLARATGQTTETGRYLDTNMDVVVNAAVFMAISRRAGLPATVLLSLILTTDFLWERAYREARGEVFRDAPRQTGDHPWVLGALRGAYALYFVPQERLLGALFERRLRQVTGETPTLEDRVAYAPHVITQVASNLGLSTQLALLGGLLAARRPRAYLWSLPAQAALLAGVQLWRERQVRRRRNA
ncbi:CDP-alcohol phosphatidyltransferase family protein [Deinococcus maricopensis]|uniref:CDP-alcohol phosphatidyltransferase n=1 Tax=Deinococcus maricopensis (strain DSM 21211 / LMG 22137 / NRRL B-23946 / LB-34) TaxID=709986 RepID=E8U3K6_DEIML|nr:CDP-alcohol phosphatidyltransferase family protein [Deinococcus maricopensis]ADV68630.1 CDP-alcohol phosphatidyltransferase [Deinococcus maricopensis DSM 21211]